MTPTEAAAEAGVGLRYLDVCAGISASTVAWKPLGWQAAAYSEIEAAPRAILAHHYPDVPLHGDFTTIAGDEYGPIDLLVGGTPCQDFSVAGLRAGLAGDRGNLSLQFLLLARRTRARWVVWENVPGVFSSLSHDAPADHGPPAIDLDAGDGPEDGQEVVVEDEYDADESHAFASFLAGLSELGYGVAYRVLDAQFAGVPQRRRRVFVVGYLGDWRRAAAVLFERHSLSGHPAPRREAGQGSAGRIARGLAIRGREGHSSAELGDELANAILTPSGGRAGIGVGAALISSTGDTAYCLNAGGMDRQDAEIETLIAHALRGEGFDASEDGTGRGTPLVPVAFNSREDCCSSQSVFGSLGSSSPQAAAVAFGVDTELACSLRAKRAGGVATASAVRRLTPRECERLQGFPDDYTLVPYRKGMMADGPRYKALGNSMAVPVMRWIGERIAAVETITQSQRIAA